jgi:myo-inositol 2-dehydrogenase / D-chiro-inositol 1-dehydrogenase
MERRDFIKTTMGTAGLLLVKPAVAFGSQANTALRIGIIGCGARGRWIADLFKETAHVQIAALHDYFQDRVEGAAKEFGVDAAHCYTGLEGYHELLAGDIDAVAVESPPYFHPEQTTAALEAGKHVYLAKPIGVDVPGCNSIVDAAARHKTLSCLVDFQTRNDALFREAADRVHKGEIGEPICGQVYYHTGRLHKQAEPGSAVARLRNWVFDQALSGDIIVEQNVHVLDVANWFLDAHPLKAVHGAGGRRGRTDVGDAWDHFIVAYAYPHDVLMDFSSSQFTTGFDDLCTRIYGSDGVVDAHYGGEVYLKSKKDTWLGGETPTIYRDGAVNNIRDFCKSIQEGAPINNTAESANSTLTSILGRTAAYRNSGIGWDEMMAAAAKLEADLDLPPDGPRAYL